MIIIDTGPLVALIDKSDKMHKQSVSIFQSLTLPPITTWACLTEAFHFLGSRCGWPGSKKLFDLIALEAISIHTLNSYTLSSIHELMEKYNDFPMDFADASLITLAEELRIKTIFTFDTGFYVFQINGKESFDVLNLTSL